MLPGLTALLLNGKLYLEYFNMAMMISGWIAIAATILVRVTPSKKDDAAVKSFSSTFIKVLSMLPTWGLNPNTKKALETLKEVESNAKEQEKDEQVS